MANGIKNYFPTAPAMDANNPMSMLPAPYYEYSGQNNLFTPRGYAQNTLVDLLSTRGALGEAVDATEATEETAPAFEQVKDSSTQSFFGGQDINEGDDLGFDALSDLSLVDGLLGGKRVSDNAPKNWNTQHQREFDALVASGYKPKAKWTGSDWYVYAPELKDTAFGEPGSIPFGESKYKGQGIPSLFAGITGSFNPDEVFKKNLADALQTKTEETGELPDQPKKMDLQTSLTMQDRLDDMFAKGPVIAAIEKQGGIPDRLVTQTDIADVKKDEGSVTAKRGGTVTALRGGTVKAKTPTVEAKPKSVPLKEVIQKAIESLVPNQKEIDQQNSIRDADKAQRQAEKDARDKVRDAKEKMGRGRGGYGF